MERDGAAKGFERQARVAEGSAPRTGRRRRGRRSAQQRLAAGHFRANAVMQMTSGPRVVSAADELAAVRVGEGQQAAGEAFEKGGLARAAAPAPA